MEMTPISEHLWANSVQRTRDQVPTGVCPVLYRFVDALPPEAPVGHCDLAGTAAGVDAEEKRALAACQWLLCRACPAVLRAQVPSHPLATWLELMHWTTAPAVADVLARVPRGLVTLHWGPHVEPGDRPAPWTYYPDDDDCFDSEADPLVEWTASLCRESAIAAAEAAATWLRDLYMPAQTAQLWIDVAIEERLLRHRYGANPPLWTTIVELLLPQTEALLEQLVMLR